jgi:oligopeptide transport system ATP-binding protein
MSLLCVENLQVEFRGDAETVRAVSGITFELAAGETLGIVGESGSGKSATGLALLGLLPTPPARVSGKVMFNGQDILSLNERAKARLRGNRIAMVFQDPMTSLNPFLTVGEQLVEQTRLHLGHTRQQAWRHAIEMLERVGIPAADRRVGNYPHQFSGGMRQRVMIAMALSCKPDVLIADEPTTALDVTIQAQILDLMRELQRSEGTAIILITHDLGVVANMCHRVNVMYAGKFIEEATADTLFARPRHPYTVGLLSSISRLDEAAADRLVAIPGQPPDLAKLPVGCAFAPRCRWAFDKCLQEQPPRFLSLEGSHYRCFADVTVEPPATPLATEATADA